MRTLSFLFTISFLLAGYTVRAQTILKQDGKFGLVDKNGEIVLKPLYDKVELGRSMSAFYVVKKDRKYGFTYRVELDSAIILEPEQVHWKTVEPEFDSIVIYSIGTGRTEHKYGYSTIAYKQGSKWGMICIETAASPGDGIFPSAGFGVDGMGRMYRENVRYDEIYSEQSLDGTNYDDFYPTALNGKYGLWDPMTREEYPPEFDTIPLLTYREARIREVSKNGKRGLIRLDKATKSMQYLVPCSCNTLLKVQDNFYACMGTDDEITFFNTITKEQYTPILNGKPLSFVRSSMQVWSFGDFEKKAHPLIIGIIDDSKPKVPPVQFGYHEVYFIDPEQNKVVPFNDPGMYYSSERIRYNNLIARAQLSATGKKRTYNFYDIRTGEQRFSFSLDTTYGFWIDEHRAADKVKNKPAIEKIYYLDDNNNRRTIGYYNLGTGKFTCKRRFRKA